MEETFGVLYRDRKRQGQKREGEEEWKDEEKRVQGVRNIKKDRRDGGRGMTGPKGR